MRVARRRRRLITPLHRRRLLQRLIPESCSAASPEEFRLIPVYHYFMIVTQDKYLLFCV